jgi:hypothetical protein
MEGPGPSEESGAISQVKRLTETDETALRATDFYLALTPTSSAFISVDPRLIDPRMGHWGDHSLVGSSRSEIRPSVRG